MIGGFLFHKSFGTKIPKVYSSTLNHHYLNLTLLLYFLEIDPVSISSSGLNPVDRVFYLEIFFFLNVILEFVAILIIAITL